MTQSRLADRSSAFASRANCDYNIRMMKEFSTSPMFDQLGIWLMDRGLKEAGVEDIVQGFGRRLIEGGVSLHRISLGGMLLHPVFGALDVVWNARDDSVTSQMVSRSLITSEETQNSPFFWAVSDQVDYRRFELGAGPVEPEFPIFERLRADGVTDYLLFFKSYGRTEEVLWADLPPGMEGVVLSLSTHRIGGFAELEINYLKALMRPLALSIKSTTTHLLAKELLDTYLGHYSGNRVLDGVIQRGEGGTIDCVLFYCDLRSSTKLAEQLSLEQYLALINDYFDCTAGAIADHGGDVLKFIGDAVMAIFPVEAESRPAVDMCRAAVNAAREAFSRVEQINSKVVEGGPAIRFGIALHMGRVMYGNVGTDRRLDFTTIGPAVNQVTRLEGLCKSLGTSLVASENFKADYAGELAPLGAHLLAGMDRAIDVYTLPDLVPSERD